MVSTLIYSDTVSGLPEFGWRSWLTPVVLALLLHVAILSQLSFVISQPSIASAAHMLEVTLTRMVQPATVKQPESIKTVATPVVEQAALPKPKPRPKPLVKPHQLQQKVVKKTEKAVSRVPARQVESVPETHAPAADVQLKEADEMVAAARVIPDSEPVFAADYLDNPYPRYPNAAKRRGLEGQVLLNVEVLASGESGQIKIVRTSGHAVLDKAAYNAVKKWRFKPAYRAGIAVDCWCQVPIRFQLK